MSENLVFQPTEAAKARNIEAALSVLGGAEGRFMARDWKDGAVV